MPDPTAPDAGALLAGQPNNPDPNQSPVSAPPSPATLPLRQPDVSGLAPTPAQPNPDAVRQVAQHARFGAGIKALLGSLYEEPSYKANPTTGEMVATPVKRNLFKDILAAALIGGAAGQAEHDRNPYAGFGAGLVTGAAAGVQNTQRADLQKRTQAQQDFERGRELRQDAREENDAQQKQLMWQANLAHWTVQEITSAANLNLNNAKEVDEQNASSRLLLEKVLTEHGTLAENIPSNGVPGNGASLQDYFTKNPSALRVSNGGLRVPVKQVDVTGLVYDPAHFGWKDGKTGEHVDLDTRTTWSVFDVPKNPLNVEEKIPVKGSELRKLFPSDVHTQINPDSVYNLTARELVAIGTKQRQDANTATHQDATQQRELLNTSVKLVGEKLADARTRLSSLPDKESDEANALREEIRGLNSQLDDLLAGVNPFFKAHNTAWQQAHFPWQSLKPGEVAMVDRLGHMRAVPQKQTDAAQQQGWIQIPTPSER